MFRRAIIATAIASSLFAPLSAARADDYAAPADSKLLVVNGNTGRVIYDDGRDDLMCVYRRHTIGYDDYGRAIRRSRMRCR